MCGEVNAVADMQRSQDSGPWNDSHNLSTFISSDPTLIHRTTNEPHPSV